MAVITISRKMGSGGATIGRKLADKLGIIYVDKEILSTTLREYGFGDFDTLYEEKPGFDEYYGYREDAINLIKNTMRAIAKNVDCVMVGRGGSALFPNYNDVLNVRIDAPFSLRVQREMEKHNLTRSEASHRVKKNDEVKKIFIEQEMKLDYNNVDLYDMIINTAVITPDKAVDHIMDTYHVLLENGRDQGSSKLSDIEVDSVLDEYVRGLLDYESKRK